MIILKAKSLWVVYKKKDLIMLSHTNHYVFTSDHLFTTRLSLGIGVQWYDNELQH